MSDLSIKFGNAFVEMRKSLGLSQVRFCALAGADYNLIKMMEEGLIPPPLKDGLEKMLKKVTVKSGITQRLHGLIDELYSILSQYEKSSEANNAAEIIKGRTDREFRDDMPVVSPYMFSEKKFNELNTRENRAKIKKGHDESLARAMKRDYLNEDMFSC